MKAFYKYSPIATCIWQRVGRDYVLVDYNDAAGNILTKGKTTNLTEQSTSEVYWYMPEFLEEFNRCYTDKNSIQREMFYRQRTTGESKYISVKYAFVPPDLILVHTEDITERKKLEQGLTKINKCLLSLGTDINENINKLVNLCGALLGAVFAIYNKLDKGILYPIGQWNTPQGYMSVDNPDGHICYDVIKQGSNQPLIVRNLQESLYAQTNQNVVKYNLQTYIGIAVKCNEKYAGSLCVIFQHDFKPSKTDLEFMGIIASALESQENYKKVKDKLKENNDLYHILYEENPSMYFSVNEKGIVLSVNNFGAKQLGYSVRELIGKSIYTVICKDDKKIIKQKIDDMITNIKQVDNWEFRKIRKDGNIIWVKETARLVRDDNGSSLILMACENITERIKAQNERKKLLKKLAEREKLAMLGQFTAAVTHEINNPLEIIMTEIDNLKDDYHHLSELLTYTEKIGEQVFRINRLARDILAYAKPHSLEFQPINVNKILVHIIELLQEYYQENITIETKLQLNLPLMHGDAIGLEIVFKNIILNAIESFKQEGKIIITSRLIKNKQLRIMIKDNGEGIEISRLKNIFEQFYTSKRDTGGTGLGLAISLEIVKKHSGTINVKSKLGEGTTFIVNLPVFNTA